MGTLGWLTWRVYQREGGAFHTGTITILPPDAFFYSIEIGGEQVGVGSITVDTLTDGLRITERLGYDLPIQRRSTRSQFTNQYTFGSDLRLRDFRLTFPGQGAPVVHDGALEGDSVLLLTPEAGQPTRRVRIGPTPLTPPLLAPVVMAQQQRLRIGEQTTVAVFDPTTLSFDSVHLRVLDDSTVLIPDSADYDLSAREWKPAHSDTLRAFLLSWQDARRDFEMWVDSRGLPIAVRAPSGLSWYRSAFEIVNANYRDRRSRQPPAQPGSVIPRTAIGSGVAPGAPVTRMSARVEADGSTWSPRASSRTAPGVNISNDRLEVEMVRPDTGSGPSEPPDSVSRWLGDSPLVTLEDSLVRMYAESIAGDEQRPDRMARGMVEWVARNIERTPEPGLAPASEVLRARRADADGHTLAFVALARTAGIPARPVSGLLLVEGQFYFHSWAEIFLDRWIPVDPTWNQFPADAGRLRLLVDGYAQPLELLPVAAGLEVYPDPSRP